MAEQSSICSCACTQSSPHAVDSSIPIGRLTDQGELLLLGAEVPDTQFLDFASGALIPLRGFFDLLASMSSGGDDVLNIELTGKSLLSQADRLFAEFHEKLRQAGVMILVGTDGPSYEPCSVTSCAVVKAPVPGQGTQEVEHV